MFTPNLVIGIAIMALGILLTLDRLGLMVFDLFNYWPILLVLFGASVAVQALRRPDPNRPPQKPIVSPGFVILIIIIAVLASSGLRVHRLGASDTDGVNVFGAMGSSRHTSLDADFDHARVGSLMGRSTLDLRKATIPPGETGVVEVFVMMGRATILVPEGWDVDTSALPVMGSVEDQRWPKAEASEVEATGESAPRPKLVLNGFVMMGKIEIES